jgi:hypothetical protein
MKAFKTRRNDAQVTRTEALTARPQKNSLVRERRLDNGELLLTYPVQMRPWLAAAVRRLRSSFPEPSRRKLQLDALGASVWDLLDGHSTVHQIVRAFAAAHRLHEQEAEVSVTTFLRQLGRRGLIGLK